MADGDFEFDFGDAVDEATFSQILEMDEEDSYDFSQSIVFGFLEQAEQTFQKMDKALEDKDLKELSGLGHFLKGSSATLGFTHVKDECEKIQNYGNLKDETGTKDVTDKSALLKLIDESVSKAKVEFAEVEHLMRRYYAERDG